MSRPPLSDAQRAAVTHPREDACVTAGAGSGKTRVLAERFVHLVVEHGVAVRDVAALTFTEKAAGEMRERIAMYFGAESPLGRVARTSFDTYWTMYSLTATLPTRFCRLMIALPDRTLRTSGFSPRVVVARIFCSSSTVG